MYHFTFIDEASVENEQERSNSQEQEAAQVNENAEQENKIIQKTSEFLHRYLDQPNCVRIFISKN
jgi:4-diphosphocytidyl-2C-methyl-D-erythritol kinase